jgi:type VI secretion system secreted protein VgrG
MKRLKHRAAFGLLVLGSLIPLTFAGSIVAAGPPAVDLGTADSYAVLAGDAITNTGATTLHGDLGLFPGTAVDSGITVNGTSNVTNGAALIAKNDLRTAYLDAEGRPGATLVTAGALGGQTLSPGLYKDDGAPSSLGIAAGQTLTLAGDASSVWIFQSASTLITEVGSRVVVTGGALECNVFWQVGSSATLKTSSVFVGTIMAHTSITAQNSVTVVGRLLAGASPSGAGALTLDTNTITKTHCLTAAEAAAAAAAAATATTPTATTPTPTTTTTTPAPAVRTPPAVPKRKPAVAKPVAKKTPVPTRGDSSVRGPARPPVSPRGPALPPVNPPAFTG